MKNDLTNKIFIKQGDITALKVDAIVNAANNSLLGGGGVDGAIHRKAGPELLMECKSLGGCKTGEAKLTKGYNLLAQYVIHTVGPIYNGSDKDAILLTNCYLNSLQLAQKHKIESIAFPAISCGVYGYPIEKACKIAIDTTLQFVQSNEIHVLFVLFSKGDFQIYQKYLTHVYKK